MSLMQKVSILEGLPPSCPGAVGIATLDVSEAGGRVSAGLRPVSGGFGFWG